MSITFIVEIFFSIDRLNYTPPPQWIKSRFKFFEDFTLRSLLNQEFQNFRIFLHCGERHKNLTLKYSWHERVEVFYDLGKEKYNEINTDYVSITRLDSDDLFHKDAMADIKNNIILSEKRECLTFRTVLEWHMCNRYLRARYNEAGPFFTHILPKSIYKNWNLLKRQHFGQHARMGGRLPTTRELSSRKVCVVKHGENISRIRRDRRLHIFDEDERQLRASKDKTAILDRDKIIAILKDFSVEEKFIK